MRYKLFAILLLCLALNLPAIQAEARAYSKAPISKFLKGDSVLGGYYSDFVKKFGASFEDNEEAFRGFCRTLLNSDVLAEELMQANIPLNAMYSVLHSLEKIDLLEADHENVRRSMLAIDYILENIESMLHRSHRNEFRREVLAQVPPVSYNS